MALARPILRFFVKINWKNKRDAPLYLQNSLEDFDIQLTEHHANCSPAPRMHFRTSNKHAIKLQIQHTLV